MSTSAQSTMNAPKAVMTRALRSAAAIIFAIAIAIVVVAAPAHAGDGASGATPPGKAWIRAGHFVPGFGAVRLALVPKADTGRTIVLAADATYGDVSSYRKLLPGQYTIAIRPQGASNDSAPVLSRSLTVRPGKANTVAILGTRSQPRLAILADDLTPPRQGTARVRVLSGSALAPAVSVMAVNGPIIASGVVLGQVTQYATVPQGPWTLNLSTAPGMTAAQTVDLASGSVYTVVALDAGDKNVRLKVVTDAAGAMATPKGGAATGEGGMAQLPAGASHGGKEVTAGIVAGGALLGLLLTLIVFSARRFAVLRSYR